MSIITKILKVESEDWYIFKCSLHINGFEVEDEVILGCKYARLYTFLSHRAIFEDNFNLHSILLELRSFFFQIFFYLLNMLHVKILCALLLS